MPAEQTPEVWAGVATQYVGAWGQAVPMVQVAAIGATVIIAAIVAFAWVRKGAKQNGGGVPLEAFTHMVEEQSRQTESLRNAVDDLREVVRGFGRLLGERTICPFDHPRCVTLIGADGGSDA
jgi:hypothetical protein